MSNAVDLAIVGALTDATLQGLMPGGVYWDLSPAGASGQFVIVALEAHEDVLQFGGEPAFEKFLYRVTAVEQAAADQNGEAARARIHALLHDVPLAILGYTHTLTRRVGYVRFTEPDDLDAASRWQHRGGRYEVIVTPD